MTGIVQDLRYAIRGLVRNPGFTATIVLSLALGTGANLAVFNVVNAAIVKDLPVSDPDQLATVLAYHGNSPRDFSYPMFRDLSAQQRVFSEMAASGGLDFDQVTVDGVAEDIDNFAGAIVSANYFSLLGVNAIAGRVFTSEESRVPGEGAVAVISHGLWERRFGRDPAVIGRTIALNAVPFTIIGVTPRGFIGDRVGVARDLWVPILMQPRLSTRNLLEVRTASWFRTIGRLKVGVTEMQAKTELTELYRRLMADEIASGRGSLIQQSKPSELRVEVTQGSEGLNALRNRIREPLTLLMGAVVLVLLIACANVANLLLARGAGRQREIGIRVAIGSGRSRLIRQLLTESLLLSLLGGVVGFLLSLWISDGLASQFSSGGLDLRPDRTVLAFTLCLSIVTCLLFGLLPALRATAVGGPSLLYANSQRQTISRPQQRMSHLLVAGQIALSLWLLIDAGLLVRTMQNLRTTEIGVDRHQILTLDLQVNPSVAKSGRSFILRRQLQERLEQVPGVRAVAFSAHGPFSDSVQTVPVRVPESKVNPEKDGEVRQDSVSLNYFQTVGMTLIRGRGFGEQDFGTRASVTVINETMARHYFGQENPLGRVLYFPEVDAQNRYIPFPPTFKREQGVQVVGVVRNTKYDSLRETPDRMAYLPMAPGDFGQVQIRVSEDFGVVGMRIREVVREMDSALVVRRTRTLDELIGETLGQERMFSRLLGAFGVLALALASVGLYGMMAYTVTRRTSEIGVRMALGATRHGVVWLIFRQMLGVVVVGGLIGVLAALGSARLISTVLFGLTATDPVTLGFAASTLLIASAVAAWLPARRAARVDPLVALRYE